MAMPRLIVSIDGNVVKDFVLSKARTTLGRRPYNDIVFDNLAVSGEHAALLLEGQALRLEDLGSTNGTRVNGEVVRDHSLREGDVIVIGKYSLTLADPWPPAASVLGDETDEADETYSSQQTLGQASIKVISGRASGQEMALTKAVTTLGKPSVSVAAITRQPNGFVLHHMEGSDRAAVNGVPVGPDAVRLAHGDSILLAGTTMHFLQP
jgi:pSer/pThr/pTyr-binding forkhead associated (FHA) protein